MNLYETPVGKLLLIPMSDFERGHLANPAGQIVLYENTGSMFKKKTRLHVVDPTPVVLAPNQDPLYVEITATSTGSPISNLTNAMSPDQFVVKMLTELYSLKSINDFFALCHNLTGEQKKEFMILQSEMSVQLFLIQNQNEFKKIFAPYLT